MSVRASVAGVLLCASACALALTVPASASETTAPGKNGQIAFARYRMQDRPLWSEIFVIDPDGSGMRRVSHSPVAAEDVGASWSPDATWIAFNRCQAGLCSVWVVRPDGSDQHRVTPACPAGRPRKTCVDYSHVSFAPDGRHVVLQRWTPSSEESALVVLDLNGRVTSVLRRSVGTYLEHGLWELTSPQLSPDGRRLLFKGVSPQDHQALFVAPVAGGKAVRVTPWHMEVGTGDWSPDGRHILFGSRSPDGDPFFAGTALYQVRPNGKGREKVSNVPPTSYSLLGSYSPDGKWIVYGAGFDVTLKSGENVTRDLVLQRIGSKDVVRLTSSPELDGWPVWGSASR